MLADQPNLKRGLDDRGEKNNSSFSEDFTNDRAKTNRNPGNHAHAISALNALEAVVFLEDEESLSYQDLVSQEIPAIRGQLKDSKVILRKQEELIDHLEKVWLTQFGTL